MSDKPIRSTMPMFQAIVEHAQDAIVVTEAELTGGGPRIVYVNPAFTRLSGYAAAEVVGRSPRILQGPATDRATLERIRDALRAQRSIHEEILNYDRERREYWLDIHIVPLRDGTGRVTHFAAIERDITRRRRAQDILKSDVRHDSLTGLLSRTAFVEAITEAAGSTERGLGLLIVKLDRLRLVNEAFGESTGDALLVAVGRLLQELDETAVTARLAVDEFGVLLPPPVAGSTVRKVAALLLQRLSRPLHVGGHDLLPTASIGTIVHDGAPLTAGDLLQRAELALYAAKAAGGGTFRFHDEGLVRQEHERKSLEDDLRLAIEAGDIELAFQPTVHLGSGEVAGCEVLARWRHAGRGPVPPSTFIPVAEDGPLIHVLTEHILHTACARAAGWLKAGTPFGRIAVNVSAQSFRQPGLEDVVIQALYDHALPPTCLELEITETAITDFDGIPPALVRLRGLGVQISIDDFGVGQSSLARLRELPIDRLKLDRTFMAELDPRARGAQIVRAMVELAHALGLEVVAEGVELAEQLDFLRKVGCDIVQGYAVARPMGPDELRYWMTARPALPGRAACLLRQVT